MMKKIFALVLMLVLGKISYSQYPLQQNLGNDSTIVISKGALQSRLINVTYTDTAAANLQRIRQYPAALIATTTGGLNLWVRNATATGWLPVATGSGNNIYTINGTLLGNRTLTGGGYPLTFTGLDKFVVSADSVRFTTGALNLSLTTDSASITKKLSYAGNYHNDFKQFTLVDKGYVDSVVASSPAGTVTSIATNNGSGITGGTITSTGTLAIDTLLVSTRAWRQKGIDSVAALINSNISGTTNYVSKFTGANTIGNSQIIDDTNVLINRTSSFSAGNYTSQKLQVTGGIGINSSQFDNAARLTLLGNSSMGDATIDWGGTGNFNLLLTNNNSERMRIASSGNVGIGTNAPDSMLTVAQGVNLRRGVRVSGIPQAPGTKALRIDASGNISYADTLIDAGGTVTSVATNNGTGITGGTITTSGTLAIDTTNVISTKANVASGLAGKLNISDTAAMLSPYLRSNTAAATYVPQTRTLTINGTTQDLSANRTYNVGTVTSVGLTMPAAFNVANSPVTGSGTLAVTGAGLASQYIRGDGTLANFPGGGGGGGASISYYLNGSVNQGTFGGNTYYEMNKVPILGAGTNFSINANGYIAQFITDAGDPGLLNIPAGNWNFETFFSASSGGGTPTYYVELYKYDGTTFTLIASGSTNPDVITGGTSVEAYFSTLPVPQTTLTLTDRLAVRIYVTHAGRTVTLHTEDNNLCQIITTFTTGITALNSLTAQVQYLTTGTSGTDFNISSLTDTHTFNLPVASATNTGKLSSANWSTFNSKIGPSDTASMLLPYLRKADTTAMLANYVNNVGYGLLKSGQVVRADSATLANYFLRRKDSLTSTNLLGYVTRKVLADTAAAIRSADAGGTVTSVATNNGTGITGGTITTSGTLAIDTLLISTRAWRQKGIDSVAALINNNISGTTNFIPRFSSANVIGNSIMRQSGTSIGINTSPAYTLDILETGSANIGAGTANNKIVITGNDNGGSIATTNTTYLSFAPFQVEAMRITSSGVVNMGANFTNNFNKLNVGGSATIGYSTNVVGPTDGLSVNGSVGIGLNGASTDSALSVLNGVRFQRGVRLSGLPTAPGTRALRINANGTLSVSDTLANGISGSGVNNQAAFFTGTNTIAGSSVLVLDGSNIAIGQAAAAQKLSVNGDVSITTIANATIDTDRFLVSDGGVIKYRTGSEVLSDIGAAASTSISGTTNYIPKFTGTSTIGNSIISEVSGVINIGTTASFTYGTLMVVQNSVSAPNFVRGLQIVHPNGTGSTGGYISMSNIGSNLGAIQVGTDSDVGSLVINPVGGNLGLGVTPSAWGGNARVFEGSNGSALSSNVAAPETALMSNAFYNGSSWIYKTSSQAARYSVNGYNGSHTWETATSGTAGNAISFTQAMTLFSTGNLAVGGTSDAGYRLDITGTGRFSSTVTAGGTNYLVNTSTGTASTYQRILNTGGDLILGINNNIGNALATGGLAYATAMYNNTATALQFGTNGAFNMTILSGGNVGIGTTSPTNKLEVVGGRTYIQTGNEIYTLGLSRSGANAYYLGISNSISPDLYFSNNAGTTRVTFTDGGNVGIGTTSPNYKLDVSGAIQASVATGNGSVYFNNSSLSGKFWTAIPVTSGSESDLQWYYGGTGAGTKITFTNGGNVGIGTTSPNSILHLYKSNAQAQMTIEAAGAANPILYFKTSSGFGSYIQYTTTGSSFFSIYDATANTDRLLINSSGNVGIGTTSPALLLEVNSSTTAALPATSGATQSGGGRLRLTTTGASTAVIDFGTAGGSGGWVQATNKSDLSTNYPFLINPNGGNVGIGTTNPSGKLSILNDGAATWTQYIQTPITTNKRNSIGFFDNTGANIAAILTDVNANNTADFGISVPNGSPSLVIKAGGNVGIGTTSIVAKLQVENTSSADPTSLSSVPTTNVFGMSTSPGGMLAAGIGATGGTYIWLQGRNVAGAGVSYPISLQPLGGNVGIGTTSPDANSKLDVNGQAFVARLALYNDNGTPSLGTSPLLYSPASGTLAISTATSERMRITSGGDVGINTQTPNATLHTNGSIASAISIKTATYTLTSSDYTVVFDLNGNATANLPNATTCSGRIYVIKINRTNVSNVLTIDPNGAQTIDGNATYDLQCQQAITIQSDGSNWRIIGDFLGGLNCL